MNRYCPNCGKPRLNELPPFCNDECEEDYKEWIRSGGDIELMEFQKKALRVK
jgi:endogenous inhibitor of DNA gyrase (YacG/DUF329 family)